MLLQAACLCGQESQTLFHDEKETLLCPAIYLWA